MNDDELGRLLGDAFAAQAGRAVPDSAAAPPPAYLNASGPRVRRRVWVAPLAAAASVAAAVLVVVGVGRSTGGGRPVAAPASTSSTSSVSSDASASSATTSPASSVIPTSVGPARSTASLVHLAGYPDGTTVGVGMPIIATFNKKITDGRGFAQATDVTVNGNPVHGAWFFEYSDPASGHVMEAHYRLKDYWPANARIVVHVRASGQAAGAGRRFGNDLTLSFFTGARTVATVNDVTHKLSIVSDGKPDGTFPVSLGAAATPTARGIKVIMEKGASICMRGPGYKECGVQYTQRLTYGGEYLHSAPWNVKHIEAGVDSSNGCTNLLKADAEKLYGLLHIGDVVSYPNANGPQMSMGAGYGDWNVPWDRWLTGGAVPTH